MGHDSKSSLSFFHHVETLEHPRIDRCKRHQLSDSLFRAVALSAGEHDVEIYFESSSFRRGALLSLAGVLVIIGLFAWRLIIRTRVQG